MAFKLIINELSAIIEANDLNLITRLVLYLCFPLPKEGVDLILIFKRKASRSKSRLVSKEYIILGSIDGRNIERSSQIYIYLFELLKHFMLNSLRYLSRRLSTEAGLTNRPYQWLLSQYNTLTHVHESLQISLIEVVYAAVPELYYFLIEYEAY